MPRYSPAPRMAAAIVACLALGATDASAQAAPCPTAMAARARAQADSNRHPYTDGDVHFMTAMIGHHAQAIRMSRLAGPNGATPTVARLAERIIGSQQDEIILMQQWLRERGLPVPAVGEDQTHEGMHGMMHGGAMPGMLSDEQLAELSAARGREFDQLFLLYMIQHHAGATTMVRKLFGTTGAAQDESVFKFANDVNVDQTTEIARMQRMLVDLSPEFLAP